MIEALEVSIHLGADGRPILVAVEVKVGLEQVDHRPIGGGLAAVHGS